MGRSYVCSDMVNEPESGICQNKIQKAAHPALFHTEAAVAIKMVAFPKMPDTWSALRLLEIIASRTDRMVAIMLHDDGFAKKQTNGDWKDVRADDK